MKVSSAAKPAMSSSAMPYSVSSNAPRMDSLEMKPNSGGIAAMEAAAMTVDAKVNGILSHSLPRRRMSREPASWSTTPMSMNSEDLNSACASVCVSAAASAIGVPTPMAATIQPRWETVE